MPRSRGLIFQTEGAVAIAEGRKTMTRRIVKIPSEKHGNGRHRA
jgi:hypothetical protein